MSLRDKIANLLYALADEHDARPAETTPVVEAEEDSVTKFASSYREITGEDLAPNLRERLELDPDLRSAITKVAGRVSSRPTPLGEAMDNSDGSEESRSRSKEAAERNAYDRFATGIMALGQR
jgi:hypothetical protein